LGGFWEKLNKDYYILVDGEVGATINPLLFAWKGGNSNKRGSGEKKFLGKTIGGTRLGRPQTQTRFCARGKNHLEAGEKFKR